MTFTISLVEHSNTSLVAYFIDFINHFTPMSMYALLTQFNVLDVFAY